MLRYLLCPSLILLSLLWGRIFKILYHSYFEIFNPIVLALVPFLCNIETKVYPSNLTITSYPSTYFFLLSLNPAARYHSFSFYYEKSCIGFHVGM
jgi:hypothetical protein